jgi:hypothetical protein
MNILEGGDWRIVTGGSGLQKYLLKLGFVFSFSSTYFSVFERIGSFYPVVVGIL